MTPNPKLRAGTIARKALLRFMYPPFPFVPITSGWRLLHHDVFHVDLSGIRFYFHDPGGPESYWKHFFYESFLGGTLYEHSVVTHLKQISRDFDSPTYVDAGAHYGYFTVYMSKLGGPTGKVLSFEPNSKYFQILAGNAQLNKLRNVSLHQIALSDHAGDVTLARSKYFLTPESRKMQYESDSTQEHSAQMRVKALPYDELAKPWGVSPDIVKIDVHGAEGKVIAGMKRSLRSVSHLYCELHDEMNSYGYEVKDILAILQDSGFEIFEFRGFRLDNGHLRSVSEDLLSSPHERMIYARK